MSEPSDGFSLARLLKVLLPILAIALAVRYTLPGYEKAAQEQLEATMLAKLLGSDALAPAETIEFTDEDGDLLADFPADDACVTPEKLVFSYVGPPEQTDEADTWADVMTALSDATGLPVEYVHYKSAGDQLTAMATGELHIVGLNTGAIPAAVKGSGFHPVCTLGQEDGSFGYTMKLLVPAGGASDAKELAEKTEDGKAKQVAFTTPDSNSGFKAALTYLMSEAGLRPERDYAWGFTFGHETSVKELIAGDHDAAPVASDILERMVNDGEIDADKFDVLYESERFPPVTIGHAHNLAPELRQQISETLLGFDWGGTSVETKFSSSGVTAFVPVNYKDDWANIRRINKAVNEAR